MVQQEFNAILDSLGTLSPDQIERLRRELDGRIETATRTAIGADDLKQRLRHAGLLAEGHSPAADPAAYRHRKAVPILGEPLSETIIRERR